MHDILKAFCCQSQILLELKTSLDGTLITMILIDGTLITMINMIYMIYMIICI